MNRKPPSRGKKGKHPWLLYLLLGVVFSLGWAVFLFGGPEGPDPTRIPDILWTRLLRPLLRMTVLIGAGLFVGQIIEASGWTGRLSALSRPLMRWGHLSDASGASFTTGFVSGASAQAMLMNYHLEGRLTRREVVLTSLLNGLPAFVLHLPTTLFIVLPLAGRAGALYVLITFLAALVRTACLLTYSRAVFPGRPLAREKRAPMRPPWPDLFRQTWVKFRGRLKRIMLVAAPVYVVLQTAVGLGLFEWLRLKLAEGIASAAVPVEAMGVVVFSLVAEFTSGFAAAGALLDGGTLTERETVLALLVGTVVATPVRAFRHQLPHYMGIFRPKLGLQLMTLAQTVRVASVVVVGAAYFWITRG